MFALGGPDLVRRVTKVGSGGIELGVWQDVARIPELLAPPTPLLPWGHGSDTQSLRAEVEPLSKSEQWLYDFATSLALRLRHEGVTTDDLNGDDLRRYRKIIFWVASAALNQDEVNKALDIVKAVERLPDLERDELYVMAMVHFNVAVRDKAALRKSEYDEKIHRAAEQLRRALRQDADHAPSHFHLAYIYDDLKLYDRAIKHAELAIKFDAAYANLANWTMAVSWLKKGDRRNALAALAEIRASKFWDEIWEDEELGGLRDDYIFKAWHHERCCRDW